MDATPLLNTLVRSLFPEVRHVIEMIYSHQGSIYNAKETVFK